MAVSLPSVRLYLLPFRIPVKIRKKSIRLKEMVYLRDKCHITIRQELLVNLSASDDIRTVAGIFFQFRQCLRDTVYDHGSRIGIILTAGEQKIRPPRERLFTRKPLHRPTPSQDNAPDGQRPEHLVILRDTYQ